MIYDLTLKIHLIACMISVTAAWNEFRNTESRRPFDLKGTINQKFGLSVALLDPSANLVCSPTLTSISLAALALGAEKPTIGELEIAIGIYNKEELKTTYQHLLNDLRQLPGAVTVKIVSRLYVDKNSVMNQEYCRDSIEVFGSCVETVSFSSSESTARLINQWVSGQTGSKIKAIVTNKDITPFTSMIVINAIYFAGKWKNKFENVRSDVFHTMYGDLKVKMMTLACFLNYRKSDALESHIVEIPYDGDAVSFILVLPFLRGALSSVIQELLQKPDLLRMEILNMTESRVTLSMPKFKAETNLDLYKILSRLGITSMFSKQDTALNNILESQTDRVHISKIIQKSFIEVSETGGILPNAFAISETTSMLEIKINANYPFLFYIKSRSQQLFAGICNGPEF